MTSPDYVELRLLRNRGWPSPEDSWGLTPMFGAGGWCEGCGTPRCPQVGSIILRSSGMAGSEGWWIPNWRFDALCVAGREAARARTEFGAELRSIGWTRGAPVAAFQVVVPVVGERWYDPDALTRVLADLHGESGRTCDICGVRRWLPAASALLPPVTTNLSSLSDAPVIASPEWFGDGWKSFRQLRFRSDIAAAIVSASPRDFSP